MNFGIFAGSAFRNAGRIYLISQQYCSTIIGDLC